MDDGFDINCKYILSGYLDWEYFSLTSIPHNLFRYDESDENN